MNNARPIAQMLYTHSSYRALMIGVWTHAHVQTCYILLPDDWAPQGRRSRERQEITNTIV